MRKSSIAILAFGAASFVRCSAYVDHFRKDADHEVGEIVAEKEQRLFGKATGFTVEQARDALRSQLQVELERLREERHARLVAEASASNGVAAPPPALPEVQIGPAKHPEIQKSAEQVGKEAEVQRKLQQRLDDVAHRHAAEIRPFEATAPPLLPARTITLTEALQAAADNARDYQSQKEQVYQVALDLTFQRYLFDSHFGVTSDYNWSSSPGTSTRVREGSLDTKFSMTRKLATGGLLVFDFTNTLLHKFTGVDFTNGKRTTDSSLMDVSISQPLLRGAGWNVAQEPLVQAERNAIYQLRAFERFRQEFAVSVATQYYDLLQRLDQIDNAQQSYVQFIDSRERSEALTVRGRLSQIQLDQATSSELNARNSWILAQRSYQDALDNFKVTLGLPMESNLVPDRAELEKLRAQSAAPFEYGEERAIDVALVARLDYVNSLEKLEDAQRRVKVAADALSAGLSVRGGVSVPTKTDKPFDLQAGDAIWSVGATLDLPLDRLAERNDYRVALIQREAQGRALSLQEDTVKQDVRDALRRLAQLRETKRITAESVDVAERRVQSTALTFEMGRIQIRDVLDATSALNQAKNQMSSALVDYQIAQFQLARDMGLLELGPDGIVVVAPPPADAGAAPGKTAADATPPAGENRG
jgi:outer membrane protein TolC